MPSPARDLDQRQLGAALEPDRVARMERRPRGHGCRWRGLPARSVPPSTPSGTVMMRAVLGEHRVQRHHRQRRHPAGGRNRRRRAKGVDAQPVGRDGEILAPAPVHEHQARRVDRRQPREQRARFGEARSAAHGRRPRRAGAGSCISRPRRACSGRPEARKDFAARSRRMRVARQALAQALEAREEAVRRALQDCAAHATRPPPTTSA